LWVGTPLWEAFVFAAYGAGLWDALAGGVVAAVCAVVLESDSVWVVVVFSALVVEEWRPSNEGCNLMEYKIFAPAFRAVADVVHRFIRFRHRRRMALMAIRQRR
jgi:hypothetical protein